MMCENEMIKNKSVSQGPLPQRTCAAAIFVKAIISKSSVLEKQQRSTAQGMLQKQNIINRFVSSQSEC